MTVEANLAPPPPRALYVRRDTQIRALRSLDEAIGFIRTFTGHPLAEYSELLLHQMESASTAELQRRAWRAFETWMEVLDLVPSPHGKRAA